MKNKVTIILLTILVLGGFLRFYKLGDIPNGLYQDETAIGWNAYSILTTGKDEYANSLPLYFKSFGDYKLPVYVYLTVPSIKLFGLTPFAVRLPSALFGFLTLPIFYFLVRDLTKRKSLALLSTFLLSINPWHLHYSRATFEVSIVLFLFTAGLLLFHHGVQKKRGAFVGSITCFGLALYSYNLTRLLSPMIIIGLLILYRKYIKNITFTEKVVGIIWGGILLLPFIFTYLNKGGVSSASGTLIFSSAVVQAPLLEFRSFFVPMPLVNKLLFNSATLIFWQYLTNIVSYFSISFFFLSGSQHGNHGIGTNGQLFLFELPFVLWGIYLLFREKSEEFQPFILIAAATILVASLTREAPHATRSFTLLLFLPVISALGILRAYNVINRRLSLGKIFIGILFFGLATFSVLHYFFSYYIRFPIAYAKYWREEDQALTEYIKNNYNNYDKIIIDKDSGFIYSSLLFYFPISPQDFQKTVVRESDDNEGMSTVTSFDKFIYKDIKLDTELQQPNNLIILSANKLSSIKPDKVFFFPVRPVVIAVKQNLINYPTQEAAYAIISTKK